MKYKNAVEEAVESHVALKQWEKEDELSLIWAIREAEKEADFE